MHPRLEKKTVNAFNTTLEAAHDRKADMRTAAYMVAMNRVAEAMRIRGWG